jgi:hypothetical protein
MLSAADETSLKGLVSQSNADDSTKTLLIRLIDALASKGLASADQTVGLASGSFAASGAETLTIKNGLITAKA